MSSYLGKPASHINIIVAHLGSGASVCAIRDGKSLDTSMGLTPLDGLPGGTRSGSVDPALIFHHTKDAANDADFKGTNLSKGEMVLNQYVVGHPFFLLRNSVFLSFFFFPGRLMVLSRLISGKAGSKHSAERPILG
jgi:Acetokinase family